MFSRSAYGLINARNELVKLLEAGLAGAYDPVSATRVWNEAESIDERVTKVPLDMEESPEDDPPGFVDVLLAGEEGQEALNNAAARIGNLMERLGELASQSAMETQESDAQNRGMKGRMAVAVRYASGLAKLADEFEEAAVEYDAAMLDVSAANLAIIGRLEEDPSQLPAAETWALVTRRLAQTARESLAGLSDFVESMKENAKLARVMRDPTTKIVRALDRFSRSTEVADEWDRRLQSLGVSVPPPEWEPPEDPPQCDETLGAASLT
jgi:hypothetical protein